MNRINFVLKVGCNLLAAAIAYVLAIAVLALFGWILGWLDFAAYHLLCRVLSNCKTGYADYYGSEMGGGEYLVGDKFALLWAVVTFLVVLVYSQRRISRVLWGLIRGGT